MDAIQAITVPKWGLTMTEATVNLWHVQEGTPIAVGDALLDMETSKITNTVESAVAGKLRRIVAQPGVTLPVAALLGVVAGDRVADGDIEAFINQYRPEETAGTDRPAAPPAAPQPAPALQQCPTPPAALAQGDDDSAVAASSHARRLAAQHRVNLHNVGASGRHGRVSRADVVAAITAAGGDVAAAAAAVPPRGPSSADDSRVKATPVARRLARELGINLHDCRASGSHRRVCKADVEAADSRRRAAGGSGGAQAPAVLQPAADYQAIPMNAMRRTIAERLQRSKQQAPHYRVSVEAELDSLLSLAAQINTDNPAVKISINDFVIKACAMALVKVPQVNIQFDAASGTIRRFKDAHIAVAVAVDGGLITPIVASANRRGLLDISAAMTELSTRARAGTLQPEAFEGGTFSISNLGMFGVRQFDAIINPPQGAILAVGRAEQRPAVKRGELQVATLMTLSLAADHRVIDGAVAATFLQALQRFIEQPALMVC